MPLCVINVKKKLEIVHMLTMVGLGETVKSGAKSSAEDRGIDLIVVGIFDIFDLGMLR